MKIVGEMNITMSLLMGHSGGVHYGKCTAFWKQFKPMTSDLMYFRFIAPFREN